jgi:hypothetical protein
MNPSAPVQIDATVFTANASGNFANANQHFAYDTTNGNLFYSATGSNLSEKNVATFTGAPSVSASNILFEH